VVHKSLPLCVHIACICLILCAACGRADRDREPSFVPTVIPRLVRTIPHDTAAFTQGLVFVDGRLVESTGAPRGRQSSLRVIDPSDGRVVRSRAVPGVFAEGIAAVDTELYQLTWRSGIALVYSLPSLHPVRRDVYRGEGWGLCWDGECLIMSTGSDTLFFRDTGFEPVRQVAVRLAGRPLVNINELEYARGKIYANVWFSTYVFEIDPQTGNVLRTIDCTALAERAGAGGDRVLNGIARNDTAGTFFLTGKDWPVMFEVVF
jgi:glutamine cyclotransferase